MLAANRLDNKLPSGPPASTSNDSRLFLHMQYHPSTPNRQELQRLFREHLSDSLFIEIEKDIRLTVAYSRLPNIGDLTSRTTLEQVQGCNTLVSSRIQLLNNNANDTI